jgi:hypothetical protein
MSFNQGVTPTIACFNAATTPEANWGVTLDALIAAMQVYVDQHVQPVWGTPAKLEKSTGFVPGAWAMVFLDDADQPGALAYHDLTPEGLPLSKVFIKTILADNELVSVSASHELVEMLVDPAINMYTTGPDLKPLYAYDNNPLQTISLDIFASGAMYAYESADPVEEVTFKVNGIDMSDFVYPAYFEEFRAPGSVQFDHEKKVTRPFQILPGGYQILVVNDHFTNVFGSKAKEERFAREDRRGHRSETRKTGDLKRARIGAVAPANAQTAQTGGQTPPPRNQVGEIQTLGLESLPQARQKIMSDIAARTAQHQAAIAAATASGVFSQPNAPLNLLADGDSWFDYPLNGTVPFFDCTDIIAQLPGLCAKAPFILKLAHYGDATTTELGLSRVQKIRAAINNQANGKFDAILFSGGGDDLVGDPFRIWLNDFSGVGGVVANGLNPTRFNAILEVVEASYLDLIDLRNNELPGAPIFVHGYDFAIPSGIGAPCGIGPWLKPSLDDCGWTDLAQATQIVHDALAQFAAMLQRLAGNPVNNMIYVPTQGTLTTQAQWSNELHPIPSGFNQFASKFEAALAAKFPGRV